MPTSEQYQKMIESEMEFPSTRREDDPMYVSPEKYKQTSPELQATEDPRIANLLTTLESIKEDCKSKGIPMDLVLQSIYNRAEKAVKGYNEQSK